MESEEISKAIRIAKGAERHRAFASAVLNSPGVQKVMDEQGQRLAEAFKLQIKVGSLLPPELEARLEEQNQRIAEMLRNATVGKSFASFKFTLPDDWPDQVAAYREEVTTEVASDGLAAVDGGGIGRLAEDREGVIISLKRVGYAAEGFAYLPHSPISPFIGYLILMLAVLGEIADEILGEREDDT